MRTCRPSRRESPSRPAARSRPAASTPRGAIGSCARPRPPTRAAPRTSSPAAPELDNLVCVRTLSKVFGLAGLRVGYCVASPRLAAELSARRSPAPIPTSSATLATAALQRAEIEPELRATTAERERVRAALLAAGFDAPPTHTNFVVVRTPQARTLAGQLERRGLVVRAYHDFLRITVRSPADDDLLLAALGVHAPSASTRAATVLGPGIRVSLVT